MAKPRKKDRLETSPWSGLRRSGASVIEGYSEAAARWEKIAEVASSPSIDSGSAADFIMRVMTEHSRQRAIIGELMAARSRSVSKRRRCRGTPNTTPIFPRPRQEDARVLSAVSLPVWPLDLC